MIWIILWDLETLSLSHCVPIEKRGTPVLDLMSPEVGDRVFLHFYLAPSKTK